MRDNLQRAYGSQEEAQVNTQTYIHSIPQESQQVKKQGWSVTQKLTVSILSIAVALLCVVTIAVSNKLQTINRQVQDIANQTTEVQVHNNELEQSVSELSRYDRIYKIAESYGLELNDQKVRNVAK